MLTNVSVDVVTDEDYIDYPPFADGDHDSLEDLHPMNSDN